VIGCEICEDLWCPLPPSTHHALAGATVICNPSASDETTTKDTYRRNLVSQQSARLVCAYLYSCAGEGESTQDLVYSGHNMIAEYGSILKESRRFQNSYIETEIDLQRLEEVYPDEAAFFREYGVTTLLAAPFSKRINQGFIAVDDPTRYTDDPVFLFIASYAVVVELNEIKQQQSLLAAAKASKYNPEDIHINFFGGMEIISSKGTLTGEDIKADQCYLLLAYLILNHKKNFSVDTLAEIICPYDELDSPYKVVNNIVYRLRRTLSVIGLDKLVIGKNGTFQINSNFNIHTDFDRFESACIQLKTEEKPDMRHSLYHSAIDLYKGQLLPRCEHELWLMQLSMYYQSLYLQITKGYVRLKMECKDYILA
jgi:hypothetical protein